MDEMQKPKTPGHPDEIKKKSMPTQIVEALDALRTKLGMGGEKTQVEFTRYNPSRSEIRQLTKMMTALRDNRGIRLAQFIDPKTGDLRTMVWPASGAFHNDFVAAIVKAYNTRTIVAGTHFSYDVDGNFIRSPGFSEAKLDEIMQWIAAPIQEKPKEENQGT